MEHVATTPKKEPKFARKYFLTKAQIRMLTKAAERAGSDRSAMLGIMIEYCDEVFRISDTKKGAAIMAASRPGAVTATREQAAKPEPRADDFDLGE